MAATNPTAQSSQPPALATVEIQDTRQSPYTQLWRDTPFEGQILLLAGLAVALILVARQAGVIAKARWHGGADKREKGESPPAPAPATVDLSAVLDELRSFGQQVAELKTQQTVVPSFMTAAVERSERSMAESFARLERRFEEGLVRVHDRVDSLTASKANAADLHRLEQRVDRLADVP